MQKMDRWQRIWNDDGDNRYAPAKIILHAVSLLYLLIIKLRNLLYDHKFFPEVKLPCPVISVGNITAGGTGKTPCVIMLAQIVKEMGFKPAVLSRGYGGSNKAPVNVVSDGSNILLSGTVAGDEPSLIARSLQGVPVLIGPQRSLTGRAAIDKFGVDMIICDDAFQHRRIFRDINLLLLDGRKPFGNGYLLPRGELREPLRELRRADAFILTRSDEAGGTDSISGKFKNTAVFAGIHRPVDLVRGDYGATLPFSALQGKKICGFAGIARPDSFKKSLLAAGAQIISFAVFPDHHAYSKQELETIYNNFTGSGADFLLTTEKDGMRLQEFPVLAQKIYLLRIAMTIIPADQPLKKFIAKKLECASAGLSREV